MKPSDELFKLIKSLTKAEKIFFKRFSKRHVIGDYNKYIKLFNEIEKQKQYDESRTINSFKNDRFVNQLHVAKNYLFNSILKALSDFHSEKATIYIIAENIRKIRILVDKNLIKSALKLIKKTKQLAYDNYHYELLYQVYEIESFVTARKYTKYSQTELETINFRKQETLKKLGVISAYKSINQKLNLLTSKWSYSKENNSLQEVKNILNKKIVKNEKYAAEYSSKFELYNIKSKAYRFLLDDERSLLYRKKAVDLMEQYPEIIEKYPERYVARIYDLINFALGTETGVSKKFPIEEYFEKMKNFMKLVINSAKNTDTKALSWHYYYLMQIGYHYTKLNQAAFIKTMEEVKSNIDIYKENLRTKYLLDIYYYCAISYFEFGMYNDSLKWLINFMNHKKAPDYEEVYHTMMIFSIILHYELGNYDLCEALINNTKRYYKKRQKLYEAEKVLLAKLRLLISSDKKESVKIFKELILELEILSKKDSEKRFLNAFDFKRWAEKKLGNVFD